MTISDDNRQVVHQELALDSYLRTLLDEMPAVEPEHECEPLPPLGLNPTPGTGLAVTADSVKPAKIVETKTPSQESSAITTPLAVMPEWAHYEFQAIFFKVGKLILATPLTELSRTLKFDRVVTKIPRQPSWFLGLLEDQNKKIGILDTSQLIMGKSQGLKRDLIEQPFKSMLVSQDGNWALACDELLSIGKLAPEQVRWRTNRQSKPWLIGTVIEQLTAVIDVNQLTPRRKSG